MLLRYNLTEHVRVLEALTGHVSIELLNMQLDVVTKLRINLSGLFHI
mgnify:CR=1 FL=1